MPKGGRRNFKKNNNITSDVKLSDFADSCTPSGGRLRKSAGNSLSKEVEDIRNNEETLWFERDVEEFDLLNISTENRKKAHSKSYTVQSINGKENHYPIDVWFLIGHYIKPEDVKLFASICKDSYLVSRSYSFWMEMYRRHYNPVVSLPARLQPDGIDQAFSLKPCVVRSLFHMYPHFAGQLASTDVYCLSNLCCTLMWRVQENGKWVFHFKFRPANCAPPDVSITSRIALRDLWSNPDTGQNVDKYINHNPDEGKVLRFACSHFVVVPPDVMGARLSDVRTNLAHDMRRQKLQLTFSHSSYRQTNSKSVADVVEFDAVENLIILNWWHPQYPFSYK